MTIGQVLRELRIEANLTQSKLSELCGIADSNIRKYETDKQTPKWSTIERIVNAILGEITFFDVDLFQKLRAETNGNHIIIMITSLIEEKYFKKVSVPLLFSGLPGLEANEIFSNYLTKYESMLIETFRELNEKGQQRALEYVELVALAPEYKKDTE